MKRSTLMTFVKISAHTQMKVGEEEEMARKAQLRLHFQHSLNEDLFTTGGLQILWWQG